MKIDNINFTNINETFSRSSLAQHLRNFQAKVIKFLYTLKKYKDAEDYANKTNPIIYDIIKSTTFEDRSKLHNLFIQYSEEYKELE